MADRQNGIPVHVDISDLPMKRGIITNRNKFILGPSGSGKSFFTNHLVRNYYEQGAHILLVDTGNSYQGLCRMIHDRTRGGDGIYITYEEDNPISFNPFYTDSGQFDVEKRESIKTLILTLWKREDEAPKRSEEVALSGAVNAYIRKITGNREARPDFNGFYEFVDGDYRRMIAEKKVREKDFDIDGFLNVLEPFYKGGDYDFLLNSDRELDLTNRRFIVFEPGQHQRQQGAAACGDADHHGDLHRQDAPSERNPQDNIDRGVLESPYVRQHERLYPIFVQDRPEIFR